MPGAHNRTCPGSRVARENARGLPSEYAVASGFDFKRFGHGDVVTVFVCFETGRAAPQHAPTGHQAMERLLGDLATVFCLFAVAHLDDDSKTRRT